MMLQASQFRSIIPEGVVREIRREPDLKVPSDATLPELIREGTILVASDTDISLGLAIDLAGAAAPNDLDDGEAFAIALAVTRNATLVLDERKARRIVQQNFPALRLMFTIEYMEEIARFAGLSPIVVSDIIYSALHYARMRVPRERCKEICAMIGQDRARSCPSLGFIAS
jgi:predicted nucleic acid-binding protein